MDFGSDDDLVEILSPPLPPQEEPDPHTATTTATQPQQKKRQQQGDAADDVTAVSLGSKRPRLATTTTSAATKLPPPRKQKRTIPAAAVPTNPANSDLIEHFRALEISARERGHVRICRTYQKAINSIRVYPLKISSAAEARSLKGIGDFLANIIDSFFKKQGSESNSFLQTPPDTNFQARQSIAGVEINFQNVADDPSSVTLTTKKSEEENQKFPSPNKHQRKYIPRAKSGGYAILRALYQEKAISKESALRKQTLIECASPHCDSSFIAEGDKYYSAWSSMKTLIEKNLLISCSSGRFRVFYLTEDGVSVAEAIAEGSTRTNASFSVTHESRRKCVVASTGLSLPSPPHGVSSSLPETSGRTTLPSVALPLPPPPSGRPLIFCPFCGIRLSIVGAKFCPDCGHALPITQNQHPVALPVSSKQGDFLPVVEERSHAVRAYGNKIQSSFGELTVVLLIDQREVRNSSNRDFMVRNLQAQGLCCETRQLALGDMMWVGRHAGGTEYVLNLVVERKSLEDLCCSIIEHRYEDQKFRLRNCPIENIVYLVEGVLDDAFSFPNMSHVQLETAMMNTRILDKMIVHQTKGPDDTVKYLLGVTRFLAAGGRFGSRTTSADHYSVILDITFEEFNQSVAKHNDLSVKDCFAKMLLQIPKVSGDKVAAVVKAFPTPLSLLREYDKQTEEKAKAGLLKDVMCGTSLRRRIGPKLSSHIYKLYCSRVYGNEGE